MVKIKELTPIQTKGKWNYRRIVLIETSDDEAVSTTAPPVEIAGIMWNPDKSVLEALDAVLAAGGEVEYEITGQSDNENKLRVIPVEVDEQGEKVEKKAYGKTEEEKEYWKRREEREQIRFEYEVKRQNRNDAQIQWQKLAELVQGFIKSRNRVDFSLQDDIELMVQHTNDLYRRLNPSTDGEKSE